MSESLTEVIITIPPDGGYGWVIVAIGFFGSVVVDGISFAFYLFRVPVSEFYKITMSEVAFCGSLYTGTYFCMGPLASGIANRYGFRTTMMIGGLLSTIGFTVSYFGDSYIVLVSSYGVLGGLGGSLMYIGSNIPPGIWFDRKRAVAMGIASSGSGFGTIVIPILTEYAIAVVGWRETFLLYAGVYLSTVFVGMFLKPLQPVKMMVKSADLLKKKTEMKTSIFTQNTLSSTSRVAITSAHPGSLARVKFQETEGMNRRRTVMMQSVMLMSREVPRRQTKVAWYQRCCRTSTVQSGARPMYRSDVFYTGSLMRLPESTIDVNRNLIDFHMSMSRVPTVLDIKQEEEGECHICPEACSQALFALLDFSLLKSPIYLVILLATFLCYSGVYIPFLYIKDLNTQSGMSMEETKWLVPAMGVGSMFGRSLSGVVLLLCPHLKAFILCIFLFFVSGAVPLCILLSTNLIYQYCMAFTFGFTTGSLVPLRSVVIVDMLGIEKLTNATGLSLLILGIAIMISTPLAEMIRAASGVFESLFYFSSVSILLGGIVYTLIYPVKQCTG